MAALVEHAPGGQLFLEWLGVNNGVDQAGPLRVAGVQDPAFDSVADAGRGDPTAESDGEGSDGDGAVDLSKYQVKNKRKKKKAAPKKNGGKSFARTPRSQALKKNINPLTDAPYEKRNKEGYVSGANVSLDNVRRTRLRPRKKVNYAY